MNTKRTIIITLICLFCVQLIKADEAPGTSFALYCFEAYADMNITIHFGYRSAGGEHFIGSGFDFVTEAGEHPDAFTVKLNTYDLYPALGLAHVVETAHPGIVETTMVYVPLSVAGLRMCDQPVTPSPLPTAVPTLTATPCAHRQIDPATLEFYCYEPLPGGVIPLPSKPTNRQAN